MVKSFSRLYEPTETCHDNTLGRCAAPSVVHELHYQRSITIDRLYISIQNRGLIYESCFVGSQQVAPQVVWSLVPPSLFPLCLPPAGDQQDTTCEAIGQFAGRSNGKHVDRPTFVTLICRFVSEARRILAVAHFFRVLSRDATRRHARMTRGV